MSLPVFLLSIAKDLEIREYSRRRSVEVHKGAWQLTIAGRRKRTRRGKYVVTSFYSNFQYMHVLLVCIYRDGLLKVYRVGM